MEDARLEGFVAMLRAGETSYTISDDIQIKRWEKVVWNVSLSEYPSGRHNTDYSGCMEPSDHSNTTKHTRMALVLKRKRLRHETLDAGSDRCSEKSRSYLRVWTCRRLDGENTKHARHRE